MDRQLVAFVYFFDWSVFRIIRVCFVLVTDGDIVCREMVSFGSRLGE